MSLESVSPVWVLKRCSEFHYVAAMTHLTSGGWHYFQETEKMEITLLSCLRAAVMAVADIKFKHDEVKAKFGERAFQIKTWLSLLQKNFKPCINTTWQQPQWCTTWTTLMLRPTVASVNASSSQPTINSVWAQGSHDAQRYIMFFD